MNLDPEIAVEVIKLVTGLGEPLAGVLLTMDLATMQFRRMKIARQKSWSMA